MNSSQALICPNCRGNTFVDAGRGRHQCVYCGTVLTREEPQAEPVVKVMCPHCGHENERGVRYCSSCGQILLLPTYRYPFSSGRMDPAVTSIIVSVVGTFFIPVIGCIAGPLIGLKLAQRALENARMGIGGDERLARTAQKISAILLAIGVIQMLIGPLFYGSWLGISICGEMLGDVRYWLGGLFGGP